MPQARAIEVEGFALLSLCICRAVEPKSEQHGRHSRRGRRPVDLRLVVFDITDAPLHQTGGAGSFCQKPQLLSFSGPTRTLRLMVCVLKSPAALRTRSRTIMFSTVASALSLSK